MPDTQINFITFTENLPLIHSSLAHVGHVDPLGQGWRLRVDTVIDRIRSGAQRFYFVDVVSGKLNDIAVMHTPGRPDVLRARLNGEWNDRLLSLSCSIVCP